MQSRLGLLQHWELRARARGCRELYEVSARLVQGLGTLFVALFVSRLPGLASSSCSNQPRLHARTSLDSMPGSASISSPDPRLSSFAKDSHSPSIQLGVQTGTGKSWGRGGGTTCWEEWKYSQLLYATETRDKRRHG